MMGHSSAGIREGTRGLMGRGCNGTGGQGVCMWACLQPRECHCPWAVPGIPLLVHRDKHLSPIQSFQAELHMAQRD